MGDVVILVKHEGRAVTVTAISLEQAKQKIGAIWASLFDEGPPREAAAFEVIMTEIAESLRAQ
jgi:hypothetical protein